MAVLLSLCLGLLAAPADEAKPDFSRFHPERYERPFGPRAPWNVPAAGLGKLTAGGRLYPRALLNGLMREERIHAIVPSDQCPNELLARPE